MSNTLTITINNIPDGMLDDVWNHVSKESQKMFGGFKVEPTDSVKINLSELVVVDEESAAQLLGCAVTGHLLTSVYEKLNQ